MVGHLVSYVLSAAIKDKIFWLFVVLVGVVTSLSLFFGSSAMSEQDQFSVVFMAGSLRFTGILTLILFVIFYFRRSFENRDVDYLFSRPISRLQYLMAHFLAFVLLSLFVGIVTTIALGFLSDPMFSSAVFFWGVTYITELIVLSTVAMFFGIALSSAVTATLATIGFYVLARLIGDILGILQDGIAGSVMNILSHVMSFVSMLIPRLDMLGQSSWLVYGLADTDLTRIFLQMIVFTCLILSAAYLDLKRRQF